MKCNKKLLAVAAAGALTIATAVPALALENEFHGTFTSYYDLSNYSATGNDGSNSSNAVGLAKNAPTENYFVQRVRLNYNAKVSDQVKLVTKFELDYKFWGNSSYATARNSGGGLGADSVNIETKNLYLELNYPKYVNAKIGMQAYNDSFKGIIFDADMAGILLSHEYSNASIAAGFFRFGDRGPAFGSDNLLGRNTYDMFSLDAKYNVTKDVKVGAAYYNINDNRSNGAAPANDTVVHTFGLNAEGLVGPVTLNGFAIAQAGDFDATHKAKGYAFNVGAKVPLLGGTARSELLYVSGGKNQFYVPQSPAGSEGGGFYDSEMIMLSRDKNAKTIDTAIVYDVFNIGQGVIMGSIGYDHNCTEKITSSVNAGFAAIAKTALAPVPGTNRSKSDYLGTEVNVESNYKLTPNVTLGVRAGYLFLGDYFKNSPTLDNPYDVKVLANLAF